MMTIREWLENARVRLASENVPTAKLDAELLLAHTLDVTRTWIISHAGDPFDNPHARHMANTLLTKRMHRMPVAYLTGMKEFYGRSFSVTPDVLIPRPETETLIDIVKRLPLPATPQIHDVGTGSGCIAITLALELSSAKVSASDISSAALNIAEQNARALNAPVHFTESDLLTSHPPKSAFDLIVANLPYVDESWERSPETEHEPSIALFADDHGLALIYALLDQSVSRLKQAGYLLLETDPEQHEAIIKTGASHGLRLTETDDYIVVLQKD